jgi:hypothetical protein
LGRLIGKINSAMMLKRRTYEERRMRGMSRRESMGSMVDGQMGWQGIRYLTKPSNLQESIVRTGEISPIGATRVRTLITVQWICGKARIISPRLEQKDTVARILRLVARLGV